MHATASLYGDIKKQVEVETSQIVEGPIAEYVARFFAREFRTDRADVEAAAQGNLASLCEPKPGRRGALTQESCPRLLKNIQTLLTEETHVRQLGRTLLSQIVGLELATSDVYGHPAALPLDEAAILNLWTTGAGGVQLGSGPITLRTQIVDASLARPFLQTLIGALALPPDERLGVVRRYRHGVRLVVGERAPTFPPPSPQPASGPGTERQYETRRWLAIEAVLKSFWESLPKDPLSFTPPLEQRDVVLFRFPDALREFLPRNILVWAQVDGDPFANHPWGDVGLAWQLAVETAAPSLLPDPPAAPDQVILGGYDPPEPRDGFLCTHPLAARGYLCRTITDTGRCPRPLGTNPAMIALTTCAAGEPSATLSGPDVCREITWEDGAFDPQTQCTVAFRCAPPGGTCQLGLIAPSVTSPKNGDGVIDVCMVENDVSTYLAFHELVHAYQKCGKPPGYNPFDGLTPDEAAQACCQIEGEAYRAQCAMMEEDGLFLNPDGSRKLSATGIPFDVETCAEVFTDFACGPEQENKGCQRSRLYPPAFRVELTAWLQQMRIRNPANVPVTCSAWRAQGDPRTDLLIRTIEGKRDVCATAAVTSYANRIGNNMCFVGQCAEEILELQELGGRTPVTFGDAGSPWFSVAPARRVGTILTVGTPVPGILPPYTPALLLQEFDTALCKLVGLPPRTPPVLCLTGVQRRLDLPLLTDAATMEEFLRQVIPQADLAEGIENLAASYGREIGGLLLKEYLRLTLPPLAHSLRTVADALTEIRDIPFPAQMCPLSVTP